MLEPPRGYNYILIQRDYKSTTIIYIYLDVDKYIEI